MARLGKDKQGSVLRSTIRHVFSLTSIALARVFGTQSLIDGLTIFDVSHPDGVRETSVIDRIQEALCLMRSVDAPRYRRFTADVRRVIIAAAGGPEYRPEIRAVLLSRDYVLRRDVRELAMALVHEGMHARLSACGVVQHAANAARVERICTDQEVVFAAKLPQAEGLAAAAAARLDSKWWEAQNVLRRRKREFEAVGTSRLMIRFWHWLNRPDLS